MLLFPLMRRHATVTRAEGGLLLATFGTYLTLLALSR